MARKITLEIPSNQGQLLRKMPPITTGSLRMQIWPHRNGRHLLSNKGPIKVLRCKHWRYMKRRLEQFAKANSRMGEGDLSARLIWREGNRKDVVDEPENELWAEGGTWRVWCAS